VVLPTLDKILEHGLTVFLAEGWHNRVLEVMLKGAVVAVVQALGEVVRWFLGAHVIDGPAQPGEWC